MRSMTASCPASARAGESSARPPLPASSSCSPCRAEWRLGCVQSAKRGSVGSMNGFYEYVGRLVVWAVRARYQRELRVAAGVGLAAAALGAYLLATREPPEG